MTCQRPNSNNLSNSCVCTRNSKTFSASFLSFQTKTYICITNHIKPQILYYTLLDFVFFSFFLILPVDIKLKKVKIIFYFASFFLLVCTFVGVDKVSKLKFVGLKSRSRKTCVKVFQQPKTLYNK
jgi:hypothetical protein